MANSDYSYAQVKSGNGTYKYEGPSASYSDGVKTLQTRLSNCGYILSTVTLQLLQGWPYADFNVPSLECPAALWMGWLEKTR